MDTAAWIALGSLGGTVVAAFMAYRSSKSATSVDRSKTDLQWVQEARVAAEAAQRRATDLETKLDGAEQRLEACQQEMRRMERRMVTLVSRENTVEARLRYLVKLVHDPGRTIEQLREKIPANFGATDENSDD